MGEKCILWELQHLLAAKKLSMIAKLGKVHSRWLLRKCFALGSTLSKTHCKTIVKPNLVVVLSIRLGERNPPSGW